MCSYIHTTQISNLMDVRYCALQRGRIRVSFAFLRLLTCWTHKCMGKNKTALRPCKCRLFRCSQTQKERLFMAVPARFLWDLCYAWRSSDLYL